MGGFIITSQAFGRSEAKVDVAVAMHVESSELFCLFRLLGSISAYRLVASLLVLETNCIDGSFRKGRAHHADTGTRSRLGQLLRNDWKS